MSTNVPIVFHWTAPIAHALGFLTFGLALVTLAGIKLPILVDERAVFYALAAAGIPAIITIVRATPSPNLPTTVP